MTKYKINHVGLEDKSGEKISSFSSSLLMVIYDVFLGSFSTNYVLCSLFSDGMQSPLVEIKSHFNTESERLFYTVH